MLRKFLLCTVASAALPGQFALAADLPLKAPPAPAVAWSWAGFYLGAHGGYGWGSNSFSQVRNIFPTVTVDSVNSDGWVAGGHAGYNWQSGRWVAGVEVDGSATGVRGDSAPAVLGGGATQTFITSNDVKYLGTARLRAGVVPSASADVLLYATAGLAWERIDRTDTTITVQPQQRSVQATTQPADRFGWVAGVGGEFRLGATNWIGRVEYLHYDFGAIETGAKITFAGQTFISRDGRHGIDVVRGGISYKFNQSSAPLSAYAAYVSGQATPPPMAWSWAGLYLGAHGGHGWSRNDFTQHAAGAPPPILGVASEGWLAGAHAGYNWQYGRWVTGFEVDGSRLWIHGDTGSAFALGTRVSAGEDVNYLGTVRARVGVVPFAGADVLLYGTAGLAWERFTRSDHSDIAGVVQGHGTAPRDHFGWVAGAGGEFRLGATNWIGRVEYLHYDFDTVERVRSTVSNPANVFFDYTDKGGRHTVDVVRGGVSYKFGPDGAPSSAYAAYASAVPVRAWSWAGYYVGAHAGHGWGRNDFSRLVFTNPVEMSGGIDARGWVAGGQAGYNWQFDRWVAGLELDGSASRIRGDGTALARAFPFNNLVQTVQNSDDVKYLGTLRGRFGGVPFANADVLLYGTAGLAWERLVRTVSVDSTAAQGAFQDYTITPRNHFGWVAGAGGEFRLGATNWIGRVEYLHYDFGMVEPRTVATGSTIEYADKGGRQTIDVVRGGVSYKFGAVP